MVNLTNGDATSGIKRLESARGQSIPLTDDARAVNGSGCRHINNATLTHQRLNIGGAGGQISRQHLTSGFCHQHIIFDANAAHVSKVG